MFSFLQLCLIGGLSWVLGDQCTVNTGVSCLLPCSPLLNASCLNWECTCTGDNICVNANGVCTVNGTVPASDTCTDLLVHGEQWRGYGIFGAAYECPYFEANRTLLEQISEITTEIPSIFLSAGSAQSSSTSNPNSGEISLLVSLLQVLKGILLAVNKCNSLLYAPIHVTTACCACGGGIPAAAVVTGTPQDPITQAAIQDLYKLKKKNWIGPQNFCSWSPIRCDSQSRCLLTPRVYY